jgi:Aspartate/tyrosine/aromatic aminotransferase
MAVGNKDVISALGKVKTNTDSGVFRAIQMSAKFAIENYNKIIADILKVYERRKRKIESALEQAGISFFKSYATFYIWFRCGGKSKEFVKNALDKFGILFTPGIGFGEGGEGFVRISLTAKDEDIEKAVQLIPQLKQLM